MHRKYMFVLVNLVVVILFVSSWTQAAGFALFPTRPSAEQETPSLLKQEISSSRVVGNVFREFRIKPEVKTPVDKFFTAHAKDFNLRDIDGLVPAQTIPDNLIKEQPRVVTHFQQLYKNIPVMGAGYILHADPEGDVLAGMGKLVPGIAVETTPTNTEAAALDAAKKAMPAEIYSDETPKGTLVIAFKDIKKMSAETARLAWQFDVVSEKPSQSYRVTVVAAGPEQGTVLNKIDNRMYSVVDFSDTVNQPGACQMTDVDGVVEPQPNSVFTTPSVCNQGNDGKYRLMCYGDKTNCFAPIKMVDARVIDGKNPQSQTAGDVEEYVFEDDGKQSPPIFGAEGEEEDRVGDDLYWGLQNAAKYFYSLSNGSWTGFDGKGETTIVGYVEDLGSRSNFYDAGSKAIVFNPAQSAVVDLATQRWDSKKTIQVCGHEFAHGILHATHPGLVNTGEMAALNESFANIFGSLVSQYSTPPDSRQPFTPAADFKAALMSGGYPNTYKGLYYLGNDGCGTSAGCYRTPEGLFNCSQIYTGSDDIPDEAKHCYADGQDATVQTYMFMLLASGGSGTNDNQQGYSVAGIGPDKAALIAAETMAGWLPPSASYADARWAWITAADILNKDQPDHDAIVKSVKDAWDAVGVSGDDGDSTVTPKDGTTDAPPWPVNFAWPTPSGKDQWQAQIDTSPNFNSDDLQTSRESEITYHGDMSPSSPALNGPLSGRPSTDASSSTKSGGLKGMVSGPIVKPAVIQAQAMWQLFLKPDTPYYWRVRSRRTDRPSNPQVGKGTQAQPVSAGGWSDWSTVHYFKTGTVAAKLISPGGTVKANPWEAEFQWEAVDGATQYCLQPSLTPKVMENCPAPMEMTTKDYGKKTVANWLLSGEPGYGRHTIGDWLSKLAGQDQPASKPSAGSIAQQASEIQMSLKGVLVNSAKTTYPYPLKVDQTYYWSVLPYHDAIEGTWSNGGQGQPFQTSKPKGSVISPANGEKVSPWGLTLKARSTEGAEGYEFQVSKSLAWAENEYKGGVSKTTSVAFDAPETSDTTLYWRVTPVGPPIPNQSLYGQPTAGEKGEPSDPATFAIDMSKTKPRLQEPGDGWWYDYKLKSHPGGVAFKWTPVEGAKIYIVSFYPKNSDGSCGTTPFMSVAQNNPKARDASGAYVELMIQHFTDDHNYDRCWRVQAIGPNNAQGELSDPFTLVVGPDMPQLISPAPNATGVATQNVPFTWKSDWAPDGYNLNINQKDNGAVIWTLTDIPFSSSTGTSKTVPGFDPKGGIQYNWSVTAQRKTGATSPMLMQSGVSTFTTKPTCQPVKTPFFTYPAAVSTLGFAGNIPMTSAGAMTVVWNTGQFADPNAKQYFVQLVDWNSQKSGGSGVLAEYYTQDTKQAVILNPNNWYGVNVQAQDNCGKWGPVGNVNFTTNAQ